jgi:hypothetical protein
MALTAGAKITAAPFGLVQLWATTKLSFDTDFHYVDVTEAQAKLPSREAITIVTVPRRRARSPGERSPPKKDYRQGGTRHVGSTLNQVGIAVL